MRLTRTFKNGGRHTLRPCCAKYYTKLSKYEDIEEKQNMSFDEMDAYITAHKQIEQELGIDLITLFKALKNGIYYKTRRYSQKENKCIDVFVKVKVPILKLNYEDHSRIVLSTTYQKQYIEFELKDYGKTWFLAKKELRK